MDGGGRCATVTGSVQCAALQPCSSTGGLKWSLLLPRTYPCGARCQPMLQGSARQGRVGHGTAGKEAVFHKLRYGGCRAAVFARQADAFQSPAVSLGSEMGGDSTVAPKRPPHCTTGRRAWQCCCLGAARVLQPPLLLFQTVRGKGVAGGPLPVQDWQEGKGWQACPRCPFHFHKPCYSTAAVVRHRACKEGDGASLGLAGVHAEAERWAAKRIMCALLLPPFSLARARPAPSETPRCH